jgi:hypothetical protein
MNCSNSASFYKIAFLFYFKQPSISKTIVLTSKRETVQKCVKQSFLIKWSERNWIYLHSIYQNRICCYAIMEWLKTKALIIIW